MSTWPHICLPQDEFFTMNYSNLSIQSSSLDSGPEYRVIANVTSEDPIDSTDLKYIAIKLLLIIWDMAGLILNGLGVDFLWHRVAVNHAVYNVLLQDVVLACLTSGISMGITTTFWTDNLTCFRVHSLLSLLPLVFHNWAWAVIAKLR